ncbi:MAG: hypothetical protein PVG66_16455 [Chromatiales bacterium]|jgi:hydrogenase/urease accessory protein HupE
MNVLKTLLLSVWLYVPQVMAHSGHGDHNAILASGEPHPFVSIEHVLLSVAILVVFLLFSKKAD